MNQILYYMESLPVNFIDFLPSLLALIAIVVTFILYKKERKNYYERKNLETFVLHESNRDIFIGSLKAFGIGEEYLKENNLTVEQCMYYLGLLNTLWIRNYYPDKKIKKIKRTLRNKGYNKALILAQEYNLLKPLLRHEQQTGKVIRTDDFKKAWEFLKNYFTSDYLISILINVSISETNNEKS
jgi:hypothetical protein